MDDNNNEQSLEFESDILNGDDVLRQFFGTAQEVLQRYAYCAYCGAHLHFNYATDFIRNLTQETAKCPECGVRSRRFVHRLQ